MSKASSSSSSTLPSPSHQGSPTQSPRVSVAAPQMESEAWRLTLDNLHLDNRSGVEEDAIGQHSTMKDRARAIEKLHYTAGGLLEPSAFGIIDTELKVKLKLKQKQEQEQEQEQKQEHFKDENENEKDDKSDSSEEGNWGDWYASRDYAAEAREEWDDDETDHDSGYDSLSESDSDEDEDEDDDDGGLMIAPY